MDTMADKKRTALHEILASYYMYRGFKSRLEDMLTSLKSNGKLSILDYDALMEYVDKHTNNIIQVFANSKRVRVQFSDKEKNENYPFAKIDFSPLGELN